MVPSASSSCSALVSEEVVVGLLWREERGESRDREGWRWKVGLMASRRELVGHV